VGSRLFTKANPKAKMQVYEEKREVDRFAWIAPYDGFPQGRCAIYFTDGTELILADSPFVIFQLLHSLDIPGLAKELALQTFERPSPDAVPW